MIQLVLHFGNRLVAACLCKFSGFEIAAIKMWVTPVIFRIVNYPPISTRSDTGRYYLLRLEDEGRIREGERDAEQRVRQSRIDNIVERENQEERE